MYSFKYSPGSSFISELRAVVKCLENQILGDL